MKYTNKLAIAFLCSQKEHKDGYINHCLKYYFGLGASKEYKFDLFFIFDQGRPEEYQDLLEYVKLYLNPNNMVIVRNQ